MALPLEHTSSRVSSMPAAAEATSLARWPSLVGGSLLNIAIGTYYAWSVYVPALEAEFHWNRTQTSLVLTIDMVMLASTFMIGGVLQKRLGPRTVSVIGGLLFSMGFLLGSFAHSLIWLYLTMGVILGTGLGFAYVAPITVASKWFPDQRGLVNGLAIGIFAAGSGIFGPIAGNFVTSIGWRATFQLLAAVFFLFTMTGSYLLKDPPEGYQAPKPASKSTKPKPVNVDVTTADVLRTKNFYVLWFAYAFGCTTGTMVISQLIPFARQAGLSAQVAGFALAVGALGSATGRFFSGWMSDHFGRLLTLRAMLVISMIATPLLFVVGANLVPFLVLLYLVYYCYGTQLSVYTALAGDFWGTKYLAMNYGLLLMAWGFAGVLGPIIGAQVYVSTGNYAYAFFGGSVLALAAVVLLSLARAPQPAKAAA